MKRLITIFGLLVFLTSISFAAVGRIYVFGFDQYNNAYEGTMTASISGDFRDIQQGLVQAVCKKTGKKVSVRVEVLPYDKDYGEPVFEGVTDKGIFYRFKIRWNYSE
jgi:hypothetical protein